MLTTFGGSGSLLACRLVDILDRVLDKISAEGLSSLTASERRFLDEVSRKKKQSL